MKVTIKANENAIDAICNAQELTRSQVQVLFGFSESDVKSATIEKIISLALDLGLDVMLYEKDRVMTINA